MHSKITSLISVPSWKLQNEKCHFQFWVSYHNLVLLGRYTDTVQITGLWKVQKTLYEKKAVQAISCSISVYVSMPHLTWQGWWHPFNRLINLPVCIECKWCIWIYVVINISAPMVGSILQPLSKCKMCVSSTTTSPRLLIWGILPSLPRPIF
jgi:hypothetical protein